MASLFDSWTRGVEQGRENKRQRVLGQNMQSALGGDQSALSSVFGVDPGAGMQVQQFAAQQQKAQKDASVAARDEFGKLSVVLARMKGSPQAQQVFGQWIKAGKASGMLPPEAPEQFDPEALVAAEHFASAFGGQGEQFTLAPGSKRFDASGRVVAEVPFAPQKQDFTLYDSADGPVWLPKPGAGGMPAPQSGGGQMVMGGALRDAVEQVESGGNPFAVSPKGAVGPMQTMPGTLRDPGFGVRPAQGDTPDEQRRVGNDYLQAMLQRYGDPRLALAAYNWGPGNVDAAMQRAGGNVDAVLASAPRETQQYVPNVLSRAGGQGGGVGAIPISGVRPKPKQEPQETFSQPQVVTDPKTGKQQLVQFGNRGSQRVVEGYAPPPTSRDAKPPTEGERNAAGYYSRMEAAERELGAITLSGHDATNMRDFYTAGQGPFRNWMASDKGQMYRQQQEDWVRAKLRKESGAVIGDEEMEREIRVYFPQPGDSKAVLQQKAKSRQIAIEAMKKAAGRAVDGEAQQGSGDLSGMSDEDLLRALGQ